MTVQGSEIQDFKQIINRTFQNINVEDMEKATSIMGVWKSTLLRIKSNSNPNEGLKMAEHTRVIDLKNGILLVEADHPGWISLLQMHKNYILKGLKMGLPELKISTMAIRLAGSTASLSDWGAEHYSEEKVREELRERIKQEEQEIEKVSRFENSKQKKELPPELATIFADLKKNMLTNPKK